MKIAMTTDAYWPRINGVTVAVDAFRRSLVERGHTVYVIAPEYPPSDRDALWPDDGNVFRFPGFSIPWSPEDRFGRLRERFRVTRLLEELRPDIVHAHTEVTLGFSGKTFCRRNNVAHVMTRHTYWEEYLPTYSVLITRGIARLIVSTWSRMDYALVDSVIVPSEHLGRLIRSYGVTTPIDTIPTGVDPREFDLSPAQDRTQGEQFLRAFPVIHGRRILIYAGRIVHEKNIDFLLDAIAPVAAAVPQALLLLAGDGPYRADLERRVRERKLGMHVLFTGYLDRKQLAWAYRHSDAFVFSSKTETQGLALVEAMMCGTPAVVVEAMGTEDILAGDRGGFLVAEDAAAFAAKAILLLRDEGLRRRKGAEARAHAEQWTICKTTDRLLEVYARAISRRNRPR
jgi:glycosyltransferase involved in cell wall biosynthesis